MFFPTVIVFIFVLIISLYHWHFTLHSDIPRYDIVENVLLLFFPVYECQTTM